MSSVGMVNRNTEIKKDSEFVADFFETQNETVDYLYHNYLKHYDNFHNSTVYDFSCGRYAILNRLIKLSPKITTIGYDLPNCMLSDYVENIFKNSDPILYDSYIIMNPPFVLLNKVLEYYIRLKYKYPNIKALCLLMRLQALESISRDKIYKLYGYPDLILNMVKRQQFNIYKDNNQKGIFKPPYSCAWVIWNDAERDLGYSETVMKFV